MKKDPTLQDFFRDMNEHPSSEYAIRDNHVIEVEVIRASPVDKYDSKDRAMIRIWTAQTSDDEYVEGSGSQATYHWYTSASTTTEIEKYLGDNGSSIDHAKEVADSLASSDVHFHDFRKQYTGGIKKPRTDV